ncbi:ankyrin repeat domain-containing protein [Wolbachia endosymbiont of Anurida maritima]|uniref:ankyrin repeat domain-containing protein n=1 Tax=Wolbachia endosymbiont of Anurida maritima TaxID=2850562 RepID=UPI0035D1132C
MKKVIKSIMSAICLTFLLFASDVKSQNVKSQERALFWAIEVHNLEKTRLLLEKGVDPNVQDDKGKTPLQVAAYSGYTEIVKLLLKNGAGVNLY